MRPGEALEIRRDLLVRDVDGELLVVDSSTRAIHQFNETATAIWRAIDGSTSEDLARRFSAQFPDQASEVGRAVREFVDLLVDAGLLGENDRVRTPHVPHLVDPPAP